MVCFGRAEVGFVKFPGYFGWDSGGIPEGFQRDSAGIPGDSGGVSGDSGLLRLFSGIGIKAPSPLENPTKCFNYNNSKRKFDFCGAKIRGARCL